METFKMTTLTFLIPLGWIMSDAAAAHTEPLERAFASVEPTPKQTCFAQSVERLGGRGSRNTHSGFRQNQTFEVAKLETVPHLQDRPVADGACQLDLDLIAID